MRGHLCDMEALVSLAAELGLTVIEDCAHTMGATWNGRRSGSFGLAGCFSTQTYKHLNSGEGGLLTSDDAEFMARATIRSGSYMLYERHGAGPGADTYSDIRLDTPNMSARMDNLRAALLRPQLHGIEKAIAAWNVRHDLLAERMAASSAIRIAHRTAAERYVGSSIQFRIPAISAQSARDLLARLADAGVEVKWFGADAPMGFASDHHSWRYAGEKDLPRTDAILAGLFDMRLPLTFSLDDCALIAGHILDAVAAMVPKVEA